MQQGSSRLEANNGCDCATQCLFVHTNGACPVCTQYAEADRRFLDAKAAFDRALEERRQIREKMNAVHDPMHRLPVEMVNRILIYCIPTISNVNELVTNNDDDNDDEDEEAGNYHLYESRSEDSFQFTLGAVCRKWRQIVWSNPFFWRCISVGVSEKTTMAVSSLVEEWLGRSGQLPLVIRLFYQHTSQHIVDITYLDQTGFSRPLLKAIQSVAERWWLVQLRIPSSYLADLRCLTPQPHFLALHLRVINKAPIPFLALSPKTGLQWLDIGGISLPYLHLRWDTLKSFHSRTFTPEEYAKALEYMPNLISATFRNVSDSSLPITNPSIQRLELLDTSPALWECLTLPALRELVCKNHCTFIGGASSFIRRSQCNLQRVYLDWPSLENDVISFLWSVPTLEILEWAYGDEELEPALLKLLAETSNTHQSVEGQRFLPNLSSLTVLSSEGFFWSALASVTSSQVPHAGMVRRPLQKITINLDFRHDIIMREEIDSGSLLKILQLVDSGVEFRLMDCTGGDILEDWIRYYKTTGGEYGWLETYTYHRI